MQYEAMKEVFRSTRENRSIGGLLTPVQLIGSISAAMIVGLVFRAGMEGNAAPIVFAMIVGAGVFMLIGLTPERSNFKLFQWFFPLYRRAIKQYVVLTRTGIFNLKLLGVSSRPVVFQGFAPLLDDHIQPAQAVVIRGADGQVYFAGRAVQGSDADARTDPRG